MAGNGKAGIVATSLEILQQIITDISSCKLHHLCCPFLYTLGSGRDFVVRLFNASAFSVPQFVKSCFPKSTYNRDWMKFTNTSSTDY